MARAPRGTRAAVASFALIAALAFALEVQLQVGEAGVAGSDLSHLSAPMGVATAATRVYVADTANHRVMVFDSLGHHVLQLGKGRAGNGTDELDSPEDVFVTKDRIYVADTGNDRVTVHTLGGAFVSQLGSGARGSGRNQFDEPSGVAVVGERIFVADRGNHRVVALTPIGFQYAVLGTTGAPGSDDFHLDGPTRLAADESLVYVADTGNHRVAVFSHDGRFVRQLGTGSAGQGPEQLDRPQGVAAAEGRVYVADTGNRRLQVFEPGGALLASFGDASQAGGGLGAPSDVAASATAVIVSDPAGHRVLSLDTALPATTPPPGPSAAEPSPSGGPAAPSAGASTSPRGAGLGAYGFVLLALATLAVIVILALSIAIYRSVVEGSARSVVFDLSHGEPLERINALVPFRREAAAAGFVVQTSSDLALALRTADVLAVVLPAKPFSDDEVKRIMLQVFDRGMHLLVLGAGRTEASAAALSSLSRGAGVRFLEDVLCDLEQAGPALLYTRSPVATTIVRHRLTRGLRRIRLVNGCTLVVEKGKALAFGDRTSFSYADLSREPNPSNRRGDTPFMAAVDYGRGKVVCMGDWRILSSEAPFEHEVLVRNLVEWFRRKWPMKGRVPVPPKPKAEGERPVGGVEGSP